MEKVDIENLIEQNNDARRFRKYDHKEIYEKAMLILSLKNYKFKTVRTDKTQKEMFIYDKNVGYYLPNGSSYIHEWCSQDFMTSYKSFIDSLILIINDNTYINREEFIHPRHLINMKNGIFNLETDELINHTPDYYFQGMLNIPYDKEAKCPIWEKAIKGMLPNDEDRIRMQKWFGYQFIRENKEQIAHGIFGISGSGKSKIFMILRDLLGEKNVTNFELQDFNIPNSYAIGRLYGKYANINYDMSTTPIKDISVFKRLTSGDPIVGRNIFESPFEFVNYAKLSWACNKLPTVTDEILRTTEFKRRVMLTEIVRGHDEVDIDIYSKFRKELTGIFNWALEGHKLYIKEKGFNFKRESVPSLWKDNMEGALPTIENDKDLPVEMQLFSLEAQKTEIEEKLKKLELKLKS
jgi:P4 family phage/plasmid primase-like protien